MKKILALLLLLPGMAFATCTWTSYGGTVKGVCTTGTEVGTQLAATDGIPVSSARGFFIAASADSGQTLQNGTLQAWLYNSTIAGWVRVFDLDLSLSGSTTLLQGWAALAVVGQGGRLAYLPNSVTISSGSLTVWIVGG